jgi:hypothetical protein
MGLAVSDVMLVFILISYFFKGGKLAIKLLDIAFLFFMERTTEISPN